MEQNTKPAYPANKGKLYLDVLGHIHASTSPDWYLEVGTCKGRSLTHATGNYISVDPAYQLKRQIIPPTGTFFHLFQQTSDDFFASGFIEKMGITLDFAFLDGLHHFEALLRDIINTEKHMKPGGMIALHDCCPTNAEMTSREHNTAAWAGDVWKVIPILMRHRPDLKIELFDAAPTGLALLRNLDPGSTALSDAYDAVVADWGGRDPADREHDLATYFEQVEVRQTSELLSEFPTPGNHSTPWWRKM